MSKKCKIFLAIIAAATVLALGGGAIVMAQDQPAAVSNPLLARVAELVGKTEAQLTTALKEARIEAAKEAITTGLDKAVTDGIITATIINAPQIIIPSAIPNKAPRNLSISPRNIKPMSFETAFPR